MIPMGLKNTSPKHTWDRPDGGLTAPIGVAIRYALIIPAICLLVQVNAFAASPPLSVFVSILPQRWIVQRIGGERVDVQVMVPPGASPHTYEPRPAQMSKLTRTHLYFSIGVPFETVWLPRFSAVNKRMKVVAVDKGIKKAPISHGAYESEADGADPLHLDPHIWLSPPLIKTMAHTIHDALAASDPAHADHYARRYANLLHELDTLDSHIRRLLADQKGTHFMVFHPSWGYFAQTYGLVQMPIEVEGKEPKPAQLRHLIQEAKSLGIRVVFAQPQFSMRSAEVIAEAIGGRVIVADPLGPDPMQQLLRLAQAINTYTPGREP